jgi:hypothetical protein
MDRAAGGGQPAPGSVQVGIRIQRIADDTAGMPGGRRARAGNVMRTDVSLGSGNDKMNALRPGSELGQNLSEGQTNPGDCGRKSQKCRARLVTMAYETGLHGVYYCRVGVG